MRSAEHLPLALALPPTAVVIPEDMLRQVPVVLRIRVARADTRRHHDIVVAFDVAVPVVRRLDHAREELVRRGLGAGDGRDGGGVERVPEGDGEVEVAVGGGRVDDGLAEGLDGEVVAGGDGEEAGGVEGLGLGNGALREDAVVDDDVGLLGEGVGLDAAVDHW